MKVTLFWSVVSFLLRLRSMEGRREKYPDLSLLPPIPCLSYAKLNPKPARELGDALLGGLTLRPSGQSREDENKCVGLRQ